MSEPVIQFGVTPADTFGSVAGWKMQRTGKTTNKDRDQALGETGNEESSALFNEKHDYSANLKCVANSNTVPVNIGALVGYAVLTSIAISTNNKSHATMDLSGHNHPANAHADTLQQAAHGIAVAKKFGAIDFLGGTGATGSALVSGNITIACQHEDQEDDDGAHLIGQNYNCLLTAVTVWTGRVTTPAVEGWDVTVQEVPEANTGHITSTVTGVKTLALAAPTTTTTAA